MMRFTLVVLACLGTIACKKKSEPKPPPAPVQPQPPPAPAAVEVPADKLALFAALPAVMEDPENPITDAKVTLGRMLYFEKRLSKNQDLSCNSCHGLDTFGVDGKPVSEGHKAQKGTRNSPTVYNAAGHFAQFWDYRAKNVEEQAKGPILNPVEMAMANEAAVLAVLKSIPQYVDAFKAAYPDDKDALTYDNMAKAIGAFERKLVTPSRFDKFIAGDKAALTDDEKKGFLKFVDHGCGSCHNGAYFGGQQPQKVGTTKPWPSDKDQGRFEVTKSDADKMMFKVPSLRNIEKTAPYFHDGSETSLENAIKLMASHQLAKELSAEDAKAIAIFLAALTGELPKDYIAEPALPPSGPTTPKPDAT